MPTTEAQLRHYQNNKQYYKDSARLRVRNLKRKINEIKSETPCSDCGISYPPYVMQFDHVRGIKINAIARMVNSGAKNKLAIELEKCELVCANCHAERTHQRLLVAQSDRARLS